MYLRIAEDQGRGEVARAQHFLPIAHRMVLSRVLHALNMYIYYMHIYR